MKKAVLIVLAVVLLTAMVVWGTTHRDSGLAVVQAGKVEKKDLISVVSASGEVKPKTYTNIGANAFGKITHLYVKEGDKVKRGQMLAQLENVQPQSDVAAMRAQIESAQLDSQAAQAGYKQAVYDLDRAKADYEQKKFDNERAEQLFKQELIAKSDYDQRKAAFEMSASQLEQAKVNILKAKAQQQSSDGHIKQYDAQLRHASDALSKASYVAPYDGVITNLPVREGETVVVGIQNSPGSTLMTISDMSVVTAEVKVDETDVAQVRLGQPAEVTIDAIPGQTYTGKVTEIGQNAVLRSTGVSTSQSTTGSQEAKDFKVVITFDNAPDNLRPGLSTTAKITTARKDNAVSVPIQALVSRKAEDLESTQPGAPKFQQTAAKSSSKDKDKDKDLQGVFVLTGAGEKKKAEFREVKTGVYGNTDVEIVGGLQPGDQVIVGPYRVLRSLKNQTKVKIEQPKKEEAKS
jgi:HlyD family secretion protein